MRRILRARRFEGGVHGQLGQPDVRHVQRHLRVGDAAQRGPAGHIRPVGIPLEGYARRLTHRLEQRRRHRVGGIALAGIVFDHHAAVHPHSMVFVGIFRMIGMHGVGVVAGQEETARRHGAQRQSQCVTDALQRLPQEGGGRSLLGLAAHLFIVKQAVHGGALTLPRRQKTLQGCKRTLKVIQSRRGNIAAPFHARLGIIQKQVVGQQILFRHPGSFGDTAAETALFTVQRLHIHGEIVLGAVVGVPVHVDGHVGDQRQIVMQIDQAHGNAVLRPHHGTPRHAEGAVHPAGAQHPAVALHAQPCLILPCQLRVFLDLERGTVTVGGSHHKPHRPSFRQAERNQ